MAVQLGPLVRAMRPRQWLKNVLVLAAPVASQRIAEPEVLVPTVVAFVSFCLCSSSIYLANDVADRDADRRHPVKRLRPIAAGEVSVSVAVAAAVALGAIGLVVAATASLTLVLLMAGYLVLQLAYSWRLKHEPVLDLACVASAFILRAVAGGVAAEIYLSDWFLMVAGFGSLFIVAGKRYSELHAVGAVAGTRRSLVGYSESYLRFVWGAAAATTIVFYALWASTQPAESLSMPWHVLSVLPFVLCLMRYAVDVDHGLAAEPEEIVFSDHTLQLLGLIWLVVTCLGVFGI